MSDIFEKAPLFLEALAFGEQTAELWMLDFGICEAATFRLEGVERGTFCPTYAFGLQFPSVLTSIANDEESSLLSGALHVSHPTKSRMSRVQVLLLHLAHDIPVCF